MIGAALGAGAVLMRALAVDRGMERLDHVIWCFTLGSGLLGWLLFFTTLAHLTSPATLVAVIAICLPGLLFLGRSSPAAASERLSPLAWLLIAGIVLSLCFDLLEGLSPPADADSLAYHFALPKLFLEAGGIVFIPRALDGAVPLLQQLTYLSALGIGGEPAMTLWAMVTGWSAAAATFSVTRRFVPLEWALVAVLAFLTLPAVVYGGGSGQVETRAAAFVVLGTAAAVEARRKGDAALAAIAGIAAGFYAASKYPGLLFVAACGVPLLFQRRWLACGLAYAAAVLLAGGQWYGWIGWHTGDPLFPALYGLVPYRDGVPWDAAQDAYFRLTYLAAEKPVPATLLFFFLYPVEATFAILPAFESRLVGFGPLIPLLFPVAVVGLWSRRAYVRRSPLAWIAVICILSYGLWFFLGPSLRVRFYLPIYPLLLICVVAASERAIAGVPSLAGPAAVAVATAFLFQCGVHAIFTVNYGKYVFSDETRDAFLSRNVSFYAGAKWLNGHLGPADRVAVFHRQLNYLLDVPYFYVNSLIDTRIDTRLGAPDASTVWSQLRAQHITHLLVEGRQIASDPDPGFDSAIAALLGAKCLAIAAEVPAQTFLVSRTLAGGVGSPATAVILRAQPELCAIGAGASSVRP